MPGAPCIAASTETIISGAEHEAVRAPNQDGEAAEEAPAGRTPSWGRPYPAGGGARQARARRGGRGRGDPG
jgi:hypothetical protein